MAKQLINRQKYKDIKRYDHSQMEQFTQDMFKAGAEYGANRTLDNAVLDYDKIKEIILSIKGIGEQKATLIINAVKEFENGQN